MLLKNSQAKRWVFMKVKSANKNNGNKYVIEKSIAERSVHWLLNRNWNGWNIQYIIWSIWLEYDSIWGRIKYELKNILSRNKRNFGFFFNLSIPTHFFQVSLVRWIPFSKRSFNLDWTANKTPRIGESLPARQTKRHIFFTRSTFNAGYWIECPFSSIPLLSNHDCFA